MAKRRVPTIASLELPTLAGKTDYAVEQAIRKLATAIVALQQAPAATADQPAADLSTIRDALQADGAAPLNVNALLGILGQPQMTGLPHVTALPDLQTSYDTQIVNYNGVAYVCDKTTEPGVWSLLGAAAVFLADTHANRLASYPATAQPLGTPFYETDRRAIYVVELSGGVKTWFYAVGSWNAIFVNRPADLGAPDSGFSFEATDTGVRYYWDGFAWIYITGVMVGLDANLPTGLGAGDFGFRYDATDTGLAYRWGYNPAGFSPASYAWTLSSPGVIHIPQPCWFGYIYAYAIVPAYGNDPLAPQNFTVLFDSANLPVWNRPMVISRANGADDLFAAIGGYETRVIGVWEENTTEAALIAAAAVTKALYPVGLIGHPLIGICDGFMPTGPMANVDWVGLECYTQLGETAAACKVRVQNAMTLLPATQRIALIGISYTSNAALCQDQLQLMRSQFIPARIAEEDPRVCMIMMFADLRRSGVTEHETWRPFHRAILAGIPKTPRIIFWPFEDEFALA